MQNITRKQISFFYTHTCIIDLDIATASTGTTDPIRRPVSRGVTRTDAMVVKLVSRILKATSPLLRKLP